MRLKNCKIIWTTYFDSTIPRKRGRKLARNLCIPKVKLDELARACERAGFKVLSVKEARYPRMWWMESGYVAISGEGIKKSQALVKISEELRRIRGR